MGSMLYSLPYFDVKRSTNAVALSSKEGVCHTAADDKGINLRKKVVDEINGYDEEFKRNQDIEFMARAFENYKVAYIPEDLLTIHWEVRSINYSFEFIDGISEFYISKMSSRLDKLSHDDKHRVLAVIALERARVAFYYKKYKYIFRLLRKYNVSFVEVIYYIVYLAKRFFTNTSYGFYL